MAAPSTTGDRFVTSPDELEARRREIVGFVEEQVRRSATEGVVVAIGGGVNSAVATILAVEALGEERVFGLLLPSYLGTEAETFTAELLAEGLGIDFERVQLLPFVHLFQERAVPDRAPPDGLRAMSNAVDRLRMACVYYAANVMDRLVLGTENRTEWLLGTGPKYGVRRGDILPLGDCYRTEVANLAEHIGIPAGVWEPDGDGRPLPAEPGDVGPATLDAVLAKLVDEDEEIAQTALELGVDVETVRGYAQLHVGSGHKRTTAPTPRTAGGSRYDRFHEIELQFY